MSACGPVSATASGGPVSPSVSSGPVLATVSGGPVLATVSGGPVLATANGWPVSATASGGSLSATASGGPVLATVSGGPLSASANGGSASASTSGGPIIASVSGGLGLASASGGPLSVIPNKESVSARKTDSLQREHLKTAHTVPMHVRAAKCHSSTSETHRFDLKLMIDEVVKEGQMVVTVIADGGPDWSTNSMLNALFFLRLWKECNLDLLCICSYAACYSAYNPIEHFWAPMPKILATVMFSVVGKGDTKPPCSLTGLSAEENKKKDAKVFDLAVGAKEKLESKRPIFKYGRL